MLRPFGVLILASWMLSGQTPEKFVALDLAAVGAHGNAVSDLRSSEIELLDNKKPQSIVYWHPDRRGEKVPGALIVVLNLQYAPIKSVAWKEAVDTMRRFEKSTYVYFYALTKEGVLLPVHPVPEPGGASAPVNSPWIDRVLPEFDPAAARIYRSSRETDKVLPAVEPSASIYHPWMDYFTILDYSQYAGLATHLADFPGPKSFVCVGCLHARNSLDPSPNPRRDGDRLVASAVQIFREAGVPAYAVEGLGRRRFPTGLVSEDDEVVFSDEVNGIARATGGRVYTQGEVGQAITDAVNDTRSTYRLAYLPGADNWDGKRHLLKIVCRRSGVRILAPAWYGADRPDDVAREWHPPIPEFVIRAPFDQPGIGISTAPPRSGPNGIRILVDVNAADLLLLPRNGRYSGRFALQALCYSADGRIEACTEPARVDLDLSQAEHGTALQGGLKFPIDLPADKVGSKVRVVVHDPNADVSGSRTFQVGEVR